MSDKRLRYVKDNPRITVKVYDSETEELLIEMNNRNWMDVGQVFPSDVMSTVMTNELKNKKGLPPKKVLLMIAEEYTLQP